MKHVYSPANSIEAHMLVHLLEQQGIKAYVHGEDLMGAVGELPTAGLIKIAVADEDAEKAREFLTAWEKEQAAQRTSDESSNASGNTAGLIVLCVLVGAVLGWFANHLIAPLGIYPFSSKQEVDYNNDGKTDAVFYYDGEYGYLLSSKQDYNFDGKFDHIIEYDYKGGPKSDKIDMNFDGRFETVNTYDNGLISGSKSDIDGDGSTDIAGRYKHGILVEEDFLDSKSQKIVKTNYFEGLLLKSSKYDADRDGFLETVYTYDSYGEIINTKRLSKE